MQSPLRHIVILISALLVSAALASSGSAFTMFDTGETGGDPESSLIGVNITSADVGDSFDLYWSVEDVVGTDDLSSTANFEVLSLTDSELIIEVVISNTTVLSSSLTNADILSLGFGVDPDATAAFVNGEEGSVFDVVGDGSGPQQTYPGGFNGIDVCVYGQNCSGGAVSEGLQAGDSDTFQLSITGDFSDGSVDLLYFGTKFQTNVGSFEPGAGGGGGAVPEPTAALLFAVGALVVSRTVTRR